MRAFTLIELLVVITIIVVLLALLTPAMDRALYQAEMAVDGANQKAIAMGVNVYASSNKSRYPERKAINADGQPPMLNDAWDNVDDRPIIKEYVALDSFLDPLCDELDLDPSATQPHTTSNGATNSPVPFVYSGYQLFYSWRYTDSPGQRGMYKLGDRFTWGSYSTSDLLGNSTNHTNLFGKPGSLNSDVLVSDQNAMTLTYGGFICSHPDDKGLLALDTKDNEPYPSNTAFAGVNEGFYFVLSRWGVSNVSDRRGKEDINTARTDGSVSRMNGVAWDEEERVTSAPIDVSGPGTYNYWLVLPK